jgi:hydrogenase maturation protease
VSEGRIAGPGTVTVLGLGNVLMGDDAFGPYLIKVLEARYEFPPSVELIDAGTPGHELSVYMEGRTGLIVADAVNAEGKPGELRLFRGEQVMNRSPALVVSPHEPGLRDALLKLDFCGRGPETVLLVGVIPERIELGGGLSETVRRSIPEAESAVLDALETFGISPREKTAPALPDIWWE